MQQRFPSWYVHWLGVDHLADQRLQVTSCSVSKPCFSLWQLVGQFIARAVGDGILCGSYIDGYKGTVDCTQAR